MSRRSEDTVKALETALETMGNEDLGEIVKAINQRMSERERLQAGECEKGREENGGVTDEEVF